MKKYTFSSFFVLFFIATISLQDLRAESEPVFKGDAIKIHLKDASKLNRERAFKYAKLSKGQSLALSYELITMENLAVFFTKILDYKAREYGKKGVGLFHQDLVDMKLTPEFRSSFSNNEFPKQRMVLDIKGLRNQWMDYVRNDELEILYKELLEILDNGRLSYKNQNCLTRHFVESIARGLLNLEKHRTKAQEVGLNDPKDISIEFIELQLASLSWAYSLDKRAYKLQQQNIPIYCQDVPPIQYK
jgi:hypothetical protein